MPFVWPTHLALLRNLSNFAGISPPSVRLLGARVESTNQTQLGFSVPRVLFHADECVSTPRCEGKTLLHAPMDRLTQ